MTNVEGAIRLTDAQYRALESALRRTDTGSGELWAGRLHTYGVPRGFIRALEEAGLVEYRYVLPELRREALREQAEGAIEEARIIMTGDSASWRAALRHLNVAEHAHRLRDATAPFVTEKGRAAVDARRVRRERAR